MSLVEAFAAAWPGVVSDEASLGRALTALCAQARSEQPQIELADEPFVAFVAERVEPGEDPVAALGELRAADLLGVFGCQQQEPHAIAWFQNAVMSVIRKVVASADPDAADDAYQTLYCRVFLPGEVEGPPKIEAFDGRRDFGPWARTLARNAAVDHLRRTKALTPLESDHVERVGEMLDDQETSYLRRTCWAEFKAALADAFAQLEPRQRNVLRCHLRGLTADQIARIYRVHRVTVARWLSAIRFALLESTREGLRERLAGDEASVDSIVRMVDLDLTASLTRLVGRTEA